MQRKDFKSCVFGSAARKGLTDAFFGSVATEGLKSILFEVAVLRVDGEEGETEATSDFTMYDSANQACSQAKVTGTFEEIQQAVDEFPIWNC